jgi:hypothetical protein
MKTPRFALDGKHECQNCEMVWEADELNGIENIYERVEAGEPIPSGQCPDCGALCHPVKNPAAEGLKDDEIRLRLTIDVRYEMGRTNAADLAKVLVKAVDHLADNGLLSGDTEASVVNWTFAVSEIA